MNYLLTPERHAELSARNARHNAWVDTIRNPRNGWASYKPEDVPADCRMTNEERAELETHEFVASPPERVFAYVKETAGRYFHGTVTGFMGNAFGECYLGSSWRDNFGGTRRAVRLQAINGKTYVGTFYKSSGDYCRLRLAKVKK